MAKLELSAQRLRELLHYDPETGVFVWRARGQYKRGGFGLVGKRAGSIGTGGYRVFNFDKYGMQAAGRLAWLYVHGSFPEGLIDHINGVVDDNRIANLRVVSNMGNLHNQRRAKTHNKCGMLGVTTTREGRFAATIVVAGARHYLGVFKTPEAAHAVYVEAKRRLHSTCTI